MLRMLMLLAAGMLSTCVLAQEADKKPLPWAKEMAEFAAADAEHPMAPGGVVFVGSSSIRLWDLEKSFSGMDPMPLNRGFGGSVMSDTVRNAELLVLKHKPRLILVYAGDNDIANGKTAEQVADDFAKLVEIVHKDLPDTRIAYIAIKPSLSRWKLADKMQDANARIAKQCEESEQLTFIDVWQPMLDAEGQPRGELFREDGLHLNDEGYELWTSVVKPVIEGE
ncbi:SGNH/GDSL hydrolase family protein [Aeoliella sp. SH292]|uniref:SGNH/GDSL hydrolase family protein n=1 Tax=Aeoliella sp. SH292 TaxID=3454464 RepID=UPI003F9D5CDC